MSKNERIGKQYDNVLDTAKNAIQASMIMNGGAVLSLLTFIGNEKQSHSNCLVTSLLPFTLGVLLAGLATGCSFMAQRQYLLKEINHRKDSGIWYTRTSITLVALSYALFLVGICFAYKGLKS